MDEWSHAVDTQSAKKTKYSAVCMYVLVKMYRYDLQNSEPSIIRRGSVETSTRRRSIDDRAHPKSVSIGPYCHPVTYGHDAHKIGTQKEKVQTSSPITVTGVALQVLVISTKQHKTTVQSTNNLKARSYQSDRLRLENYTRDRNGNKALALSTTILAMLSPYLKRLCWSAFVALVVMLGLYYKLFGSSPPERSGKEINSAKRIGESTEKSAYQQTETTEITGLGNTNAATSCPVMPAIYDTPGKPVWVAGYPGSGFDFVAPIIAKTTGLTAVDVYRHHTCSVAIKEGAAITGACLTHWPLVNKDSPATLALNGDIYSSQAIFVIRNPAQAIPSYYTRWWGAQKHVFGNHQQPPEQEWREWRNQRFEHHLMVWKRTIVEWNRGIPAAGLTGISLFVEFDELSSPVQGPHVVDQIAKVFEKYNHKIVENTQCLWRRAVDQSQLHKAKAYVPKFTATQTDLMLHTMDELLELYQNSHPILGDILKKYRTDIQEKLRLDHD